jgi:hypothetical protein
MISLVLRNKNTDKVIVSVALEPEQVDGVKYHLKHPCAFPTPFHDAAQLNYMKIYLEDI